MTAIMVFTRERVRDQAEYATYGSLAAATLAGHDVTPLAVYGASETLEGPPIETSVILKFADVAAAKAWYNSPSYQAVVKHRFAGADFRVFITEGV
jgi:uncharacterized protein (DUF1330 family)